MMPDIHAGAGCTIGTTMTITDKVCPNLVGVDVGCGMNVVKVRGSIDPEQLDSGKWIKHAQGICRKAKLLYIVSFKTIKTNGGMCYAACDLW